MPGKSGRRDKKRHALRNGSDEEDFSVKIPRTRLPEPIMPGIRGWKTRDGWMVLRLHYSADPERTTEEWLNREARGYRGGIGGRDWQREMEIDFTSYAGDPVYPGFSADDAVKPTKYDPSLPLWRGWDFGFRHPAVVFLQYQPKTDQLRYLHELYPTISETIPGLKTSDLASLALSTTQKLFPQALEDDSAGIYDFCDPAGNQHKETSDFTSVEILQQHGIFPEWNVVGRKNRVETLRNYLEVEGRFRINPHCNLGIEAIQGGYHFPEENSATKERDVPETGKKAQEMPFIHLMDGLEYVVACNLHIEYDMSKAPQRPEIEQVGDIDELAAMYLQAASANTRQDESKRYSAEDGDDVEVTLYDLVDEKSTLEDAFLLT